MEIRAKAQFQPEDVVLTGAVVYPGAGGTSADAIFTFQLWIRFSVGVIQINNLLFELQSIRFWFFAMLKFFAISLAIIDGSTFSAHTYILTPRIIKSEHSNINLNVIRF